MGTAILHIISFLVGVIQFFGFTIVSAVLFFVSLLRFKRNQSRPAAILLLGNLVLVATPYIVEAFFKFNQMPTLNMMILIAVLLQCFGFLFYEAMLNRASRNLFWVTVVLQVALALIYFALPAMVDGQTEITLISDLRADSYPIKVARWWLLAFPSICLWLSLKMTLSAIEKKRRVSRLLFSFILLMIILGMVVMGLAAILFFLSNLHGIN